MDSKKPSLYPPITDDDSNPQIHSPFPSSSSSKPSSLYPSLDSPSGPTPSPPPSAPSLYPSLDMADLVENLFPDTSHGDGGGGGDDEQTLLPPPVEETLIHIPGALLHLIDPHRSVELAAGDFSLARLRQGDNAIAVLARVGDGLVQWPLARDEAAVKLDDSHYFFSLRVPPTSVGDQDDGGGCDLLNYGLTFAAKGQEGLLEELDRHLQAYSSFSVQKIDVQGRDLPSAEVLDGSVTKEVTPEEGMGPKKQMLEERSAAYWTTVAPNVEEYSSSVANMIAKGSTQLIKGILWCGDVTVDRLKWGENLLKRRLEPGSKPAEISKDAMRRMKRVKRVTKMSEKVATGVLSGVVKVSGFVTSSVVNSKIGKKFFGLLPGEIVLASLDGFGMILFLLLHLLGVKCIVSFSLRTKYNRNAKQQSFIYYLVYLPLNQILRNCTMIRCSGTIIFYCGRRFLLDQ
ncbi:protein EARLY-RESPONSIVE TO DEHYDRATION 7, chloroplastic-like [Curcuma longa]|uniref:protein EARLY-RESPONSIVE TO DEHYDRATION 7, chloroplastic-like n=1 Tax=Curcuma longa TaxID=136217 RepID=UPI003D9E2183